MRQSAHSLRLAVPLLSGAMFVLSVVSPAVTLASDSLLTSLPLTPVISENTLCVATLPDPLAGLSQALAPARFERVDTTNPNAVVITQAKDGNEHSFSSEKTVMARASQGEIEEANATPTPEVSVTPFVQTVPVSSAVVPNTGGGILNGEMLFNLVNATRTSYGMAPFMKDDRLCAVAASRAPEIDGEIWVTHTMHAGFYARNLPYWATENVISMQTEQQALDWWMHSPVHRAALLGNWKYACVACSGKSCSMIFTNFDPKGGVFTQGATTPTPSAASATPPQSPVVQNTLSTASSVGK